MLQVKLKNVSLERQHKLLLKNLNWEVNKGEHWAILGLNGSGKTTLLLACANLCDTLFIVSIE